MVCCEGQIKSGGGQGSFLITEERATSVRLERQPLVWMDADGALLLLKDAEHIERTTRQAISLLEEAAGYLERRAFLEGAEGSWIDKPRKQIAEAWFRARSGSQKPMSNKGCLDRLKPCRACCLPKIRWMKISFAVSSSSCTSRR